MSQMSEIQDDVQANWPTNYHSTDLDDAKTLEFMNNTQRWVCRGAILTPNGNIIHNFSWLKREVEASTIDGQMRYALPTLTASLWRVKSPISLELRNSNSKRVPLTRVYKKDAEMFAKFKDTTGTGIPSHYCLDDDDAWLYLPPDHSLNNNSAWTMNLEYTGYLPDLSAAGDTNKITDHYPEVLEYGATEQGYRFGMDEEQAEYWKNKKIEVFLEMLRVDQDFEDTGIEMGMQPTQAQSLGHGEPGVSSGFYTQDTPYS